MNDDPPLALPAGRSDLDTHPQLPSERLLELLDMRRGLGLPSRLRGTPLRRGPGARRPPPPQRAHRSPPRPRCLTEPPLAHPARYARQDLGVSEGKLPLADQLLHR